MSDVDANDARMCAVRFGGAGSALLLIVVTQDLTLTLPAAVLVLACLVSGGAGWLAGVRRAQEELSPQTDPEPPAQDGLSPEPTPQGPAQVWAQPPTEEPPAQVTRLPIPDFGEGEEKAA